MKAATRPQIYGFWFSKWTWIQMGVAENCISVYTYIYHTITQTQRAGEREREIYILYNIIYIYTEIIKLKSAISIGKLIPNNNVMGSLFSDIFRQTQMSQMSVMKHDYRFLDTQLDEIQNSCGQWSVFF
jgi:hypothetical protein